jgi:hypothetical protein
MEGVTVDVGSCFKNFEDFHYLSRDNEVKYKLYMVTKKILKCQKYALPKCIRLYEVGVVMSS